VKRWWLIVALLLSVGLNLGILATLAVSRLRPPAEQSTDLPRPAQLSPEQSWRLARYLRLDGEQRRRFVELHRELVAQMRPRRERLQELRRELREELASEWPDRDRLDRLTAEMGEAAAAVDRTLAEHLLALREVLDPEQERAFRRVIGRLGAPRLRDRLRPGRQPGRWLPPSRRRPAPGPSPPPVRPPG
jgi:Spy/CpxP family protein refolding chaperone